MWRIFWRTRWRTVNLLMTTGVRYRSRDFDPASDPEADVPDPYYGTADDFAQTRQLIEAAVPGILDWVRGQLHESVAR